MATRLAAYVPRLEQEWPLDVRYRAIEGTMVFVDISGFTALSERLARKGRVGAEEVADALTSTFSSLLDVALGLGGDLLKYGGDALLLLFTGDDHVARGTASAYHMNRRLHEVGRIDTGVGVVELRMTVGVHTGSFEMFLVGESHLALIVAGENASETVRAESSATAGEILVSRAVADRIDSDHLGAAKGDRFLLVSAPEATYEPTDWAAVNDLEQLLPRALRAVVGTPAGEGEHRRAAVAFLEFKGLDEAIRWRGPETVLHDLDATVRIIQQAADEFDVTFFATDIDADGGKVIMISGAPTATENDEERMLRAVRSIVDADPPLPLKIGVNAGTLFAGDVGSPARAAYTVIGDTVNLAARIMAKAKPGTILAERDVVARSQTIFETVEVEAFLVKGKTEPVHALLVGPATGVRETGDAGDVAFVGRAGELDRIAAALETDGVGRVLRILGPPGIGKTRLVTEAMLAGAPDRWFKVSCERYEAATPYRGIRILSRNILGIPLAAGGAEAAETLTETTRRMAPSLVPWLPLLAVPVGAEVDSTPEVDALADRFRKDRTDQVVVELLTALLPESAAIWFDNAQWLDDNTKDVVERIAGGSLGGPWLVCLTGRPDTEPIEGSDTIDLGPLADEPGLELARSVAALSPVPHHKLVEAVEKSGGNPLFLIQLVEAAAEGAELPATIEDVVNSRIDRLDPTLRKVLRYASVIGRQFTTEVVRATIGDVVPEVAEPGTWKQLDDYLEQQADGTYRFRQNLFREVAYGGLPFRSRRELHLRVGNALEKEPGDVHEKAPVLSLHFSLAEAHERSWRYSIQAGETAVLEYAHVDAVELYKRALQASKHVELPDAAIAPVAEALGDASEKAGLFDEADTAYASARKLWNGDQLALGRILGKQGLLRERAGNYSVSLRWLSRALKQLDAAPASTDREVERVQQMLSYAGVRYRQGRYHDCIDWAKRALADSEGLRPEKEAHARYLLALAYAHLADPASQQEGQRALEIFEEVGDLLGTANVLNNLGMNAYYRGAWGDAVDYWERSRKAREGAGDIIGAATATNNLGEIYSDQGRYHEGRRAFTEALRIWEGARYEVGIAFALSNLGRLEARSGNHELADERLREARARFEAIGASTYVIESDLRLTENQLYSGDPDVLAGAGELLPKIQATPGADVLEAALRRIIGYARLRFGQTVEARAEFARSLEIAKSAAAEHEEALSHRALADAGGPDAREHAAAALELFARLGIVEVPELRRAPT